MIEPLERRIVLNAGLAGGTLSITSNIASDVYFLGMDDQFTIHVTIAFDGTDRSFPVFSPLQPSGAQRILITDGAPQIANNPNQSNAQITVRSEVLLPCTINAGDGNDSIQCGAGPTVVNAGPANVLGGATDDDLVIGGQSGDQIFGGAGADNIDGGAGNDTIDGGAGGTLGDDTILGGFGNDSLFGGAGGGDSIDGGFGSDTIIGGVGNDVLTDTGGNDGGIDVLSYRDRTATNTRVGVFFDFSANDGLYTSQQGVLTLSEQDLMPSITDFEVVWGSEGPDTLDNSGQQGTTGRVLMGFGGNDLLLGGTIPGADDTLSGGDGSDCLNGNGGNDLLMGELGNDTLVGADDSLDVTQTPDNDTLFGGDGDDNIRGGPGDDSLDGAVGNDLLNGGAGNDTLFGGLDEYLPEGSSIIGNSGADVFQGGTGFDVVDYSARTVPIRASLNGLADDGDPNVNFGFGEGDDIANSVEQVIGTDLPAQGDVITVARNDTAGHWLVGLGGPDSLTGGGGDDTLEGGDGNDYLNGIKGADSIVGGNGKDTADYSIRTGNLVITVDSGSFDDGAIGEGGNVEGVEVVLGGPGNDLIFAGNVDSSLFGGAGSDSLVGGTGNDTLNGGIGADSLDGGDGINAVDYSTRSAPITVSFNNLADDGEFNEHDNVLSTIQSVIGGGDGNTVVGTAGPDMLVGGSGPDCIVGGDGDDTIIGNGGNDTLLGGNGNDCIDGGAGLDSIVGGAGNDTLSGGAGGDFIFGGAGLDTVSYFDHKVAVVVRLSLNGANTTGNGQLGENDIVSADIENIVGGRGSDSLYGNNVANNISGGFGDDYLVGYNGNDTLRGDSGSDTLHGGNGNDLLIGGTSGDRFIGGKGIDTVDYTDHLGNVSLTLDNLANDGSKGEGDKIDSDVEVLIGGYGNDTIKGAATTPCSLFGGFGNDTIRAGSAADFIVGGQGRDCIFGNAGNDTINGNDGEADSIDGGAGIDSLLTEGLDTVLNVP